MTASLRDYQIGPVLGAGGSATVSLGCLRRPGGFRRVVALKRLHPNLARDPAYRALLEGEGRLGGKLASVNVVHVLDLVYDGVEPVLVLEHVAGLPLSQLIDDRPVPPAIVCALLLDVLRGLAALHALPEVHLHRDVCPGNVLVGIDGVARLADFGIARAASGTRNTDFGVIKGTLRYMSPEQLADGPLDPRSDLFSVAVIAWELLAGRPLFDASDPGVIVRKLLVDPVPALPEACAAPDALRALVAATLSRAPDDRPPDAKTMQARLLACGTPATVSELAAFVESRGGGALAALAEATAHWSTSAAEETSGAAPTSPAAHDPKLPVQPRRSARRRVLALGLIATALLGAMLALSRSRAASPAPVAPIPTSVSATPGDRDPPALGLSATSSVSATAATSTPAPAPSTPPTPGKRTAAPAVVPPPGGPTSCDPPYRIGPSGVRTLRPECL